jgi:hypothetical protein
MSKDSYRKIANRYDVLVEPLVGHLRAVGMRMALPQEGMLVLDISCYHPGPIRFPEGWLSKLVITCYEAAAGGEHFRNYRDFLARRGLVPLITSQQLVKDRKKIVSGGGLGLFLLSRG